jgi:hypothetical protein
MRPLSDEDSDDDYGGGGGGQFMTRNEEVDSVQEMLVLETSKKHAELYYARSSFFLIMRV